VITGGLYQIVAPHFVAGLVMRDVRCADAAPILGWAVGKSYAELDGYFRRKQWRAIYLGPTFVKLAKGDD